MFELNSFIAKYVTKREVSMFSEDIKNNNQELSDIINGSTVLVIGGAGSIGSSYIKAVLKYKPSSLVVVDINENGLAELTRDLRSTKGLNVPKDYVTYPMDYSSKVFEKMFISRNGFDIVANFSAHKHVRSEKDIYSVEALLRNNVINAKKFMDLLKKYPPKRFFCVSTDKAANPVNIMGASKRIMEDVIFSYSKEFTVNTARFANVAFSNGSLPAGFLERIKKHQPLSAPSDVKRYFVSPEESGQLCMLACMLGKGREIFFPKLEEASMMSFDEIAKAFLRENGYEPLFCSSDEEAIEQSTLLDEKSTKYPVHFSASNTSGEKAYEEFFVEGERIKLDRFVSLGVIVDKEFVEYSEVQKLIFDLEKIFDEEVVLKENVVATLKRYLPNFDHIEKGMSLDAKM